MIDIFEFDKQYAQGKITQYSLAAALHVKQGGDSLSFKKLYHERNPNFQLTNSPFALNVFNLLRDYESGFYDLKHELELLELLYSNPVES